MSSSGHDQEFADFFRGHHRRLRGYLTKTIGAPPDVVDDATPFAFAAVCRHWERLRTGSPKAYLFLVAQREATRRMQLPRYKHGNSNLDGLEQVSTTPVSQDDRIEGLIDRLVLEKLLQHLPQGRREAVTLRHTLRFTIAETAAIMKINNGTVKRYTHEGLRQLRELITRESVAGEVDNR